MKHWFGAAAALLLVLSGTGCAAVYSLKPYYTEANAVELPPEVRGLWQLKGKPDGEIETVRLRILPDGEVNIHEFYKSKDGKERVFSTTCKVRFFKVEGSLYADCLPEKTDCAGDSAIGTAMLLTRIPAHMLLKVVAADDTLRFFYPELLPDALKKGLLPADLTWTTLEETPGKNSPALVFTAPGSVWEKVLRKSSTLLFSADPDDGMLFERVLVQ